MRLKNILKDYASGDSLARILYGKTITRIGYHPSSRKFIPENISVEQALRNGTVFSCVKDYVNAISEVPFIAPEDEFINSKLKYPNLYQTQRDFIGAIVGTMVTRTECFVQKHYDKDGDLVSMALRDPGEVEIRIHEKTRAPYYWDIQDGKKIEKQYMMYFRDIPTYTMANISRIGAFARQINALIICDKLIMKTYKNGIHAGYTIETDESLDDEDFDLLMEQIAEYKVMLDDNVDYDKGRDQSGGVIVLDNGLKLKPIEGMKLADVDLREIREILKKEIIAGMFSLDPQSAGGEGAEKYNNVSARNAIVYRMAYSPLIQNIAGGLERGLGTKIVALDEFLQKGNFAETVDTAVKATGGKAVLTPNEAREKLLNMDPVKGGDELYDPPSAVSVTTGDRRGETPTDDGNGSPEFNHTDN